MTWRQYLQVKTRSPAFHWRMVIGILLIGVTIGLAVDTFVPDEQLIQPAAEVDEPFVPHIESLSNMADAGRWLDLWRAIPANIVARWNNWGITTLAILTGLCWMAFALQAVQPRSAWDHRLATPLIGFVLGVVSIWPTLFFIYWQ